MITVVNIIPPALSGESNQDSEPNIAVNPANPNQIAISAFTPDPMGGPNAPIYVSTDGGATWTLNSIVPSTAGAMSGTGDITPRFGSAGNRLYAGILRFPGSLRLNVLRSTSFTAPTTMTVLEDRNHVDQPYTQAITVSSGPAAGKDRLYVGLNDFAAPGGKTATVDRSLDAGATSPSFTSIRIEKRTTSGQNGPQIRPALHPDGTVYAIFYGWRSFNSTTGLVNADVVVVRDDAWASGASPFTALADPGDGLAGRRVATSVSFTWNGTLGQDRLGGDLAIAVDPTNSSRVYVAYCDVQSGSYTLHVRRSTDRGVTWSADLKTIARAKNPALAINSAGKVGLAYQRVTGTGTAQRWETHLELTTTGFSSSTDMVLATVPATTPAPKFLPYIGDYMHMMAVGTTFYGVFSANNTPDPANFPSGVTFLRNHNFTTKKLLALNGVTEVPVSIDPFFFKYTESIITKITLVTPLTLVTPSIPVTPITPITPITHFTPITPITKLTLVTPLTPLTHITPLTPFTPITQFTPIPPVTPPGPKVPGVPGIPGVPGQVEPFIRFGNTLFAPEQLDLGRFAELAGVAPALGSVGITRLHQLVSADPFLLTSGLGISTEDALGLIALAQSLIRALAS